MNILCLNFFITEIVAYFAIYSLFPEGGKDKFFFQISRIVAFIVASIFAFSIEGFIKDRRESTANFT